MYNCITWQVDFHGSGNGLTLCGKLRHSSLSGSKIKFTLPIETPPATLALALARWGQLQMEA